SPCCSIPHSTAHGEHANAPQTHPWRLKRWNDPWNAVLASLCHRRQDRMPARPQTQLWRSLLLDGLTVAACACPGGPTPPCSVLAPSRASAVPALMGGGRCWTPRRWPAGLLEGPARTP